MAVHIKERAINLRKKGFSYSLISSKTGVSKSTLNYWLRDILYVPNSTVLRRIRESSFKSAKIRKAKKIEDVRVAKEKAVKELGNLTTRDFWMIGIGLYIGEGTKNKTQMVRITNSDPKIIKLAIAWFKSVCNLSIKNFRIAIHTYPDLDLKQTLNYWSKTTGIPRSQFRKTQIDTRQNKSKMNVGKSLHGTAHVTVYSDGAKEHGVFLFRRIIGWIESIENQVNAGIV